MNTDIILYFIAYFILYSFAGWLLESVSKSVMEKKLVNSGFLTGPLCPIYGFGAVIMMLCLSFLKDKPILLFFAAFFILSIWEYIVGVVLEKLFKTKYWDYSHLKFNIQGRVCLKNSIYWGLLGVAFICFVQPFVESYMVQVPKDILLYVDITAMIIFVIDIVISVTTMSSFNTAINKINELGDNIKEKIAELKSTRGKHKDDDVKLQRKNTIKVIRQLRFKQAKLKLKMYKQANRLKKAFPSMKSETISNFLNQKFDLKKLKDNLKNKE
ncbi:MAG: putative ABC transporter permease [Clostridia bacterium]|nr:putative ABC transporter permease [Clostridia bacterium]